MFRGEQSNPPPAEAEVIKYRGVHRKRADDYQSQILGVEERGIRSTLGTYDTSLEAALAYDYAARSLHGSNAHTNFTYPDGKYRDSLTGLPAPYDEHEYELSPEHSPAAGYNNNNAAGYNNYDPFAYNNNNAGYNNYDPAAYNNNNAAGYKNDYNDYNSGFGQPEYSAMGQPGDELLPLPGSYPFGGGYGGYCELLITYGFLLVTFFVGFIY